MSNIIDDLKAEKDELQAKAVKLKEFIASSAFREIHDKEQNSLEQQLTYMRWYYTALKNRLHLHETGEWPNTGDLE